MKSMGIGYTLLRKTDRRTLYIQYIYCTPKQTNSIALLPQSNIIKSCVGDILDFDTY
jgi:hypothetical protein